MSAQDFKILFSDSANNYIFVHYNKFYSDIGNTYPFMDFINNYYDDININTKLLLCKARFNQLISFMISDPNNEHVYSWCIEEIIDLHNIIVSILSPKDRPIDDVVARYDYLQPISILCSNQAFVPEEIGEELSNIFTELTNANINLHTLSYVSYEDKIDSVISYVYLHGDDSHYKINNSEAIGMFTTFLILYFLYERFRIIYV